MAASTGYYEIYQSGYQWRWRFKSNNHEVIASGESYWNKADCLNAIGLMKGSKDAPVYER
ncbi:YegP family protein [Mesorhizobium newzealandense]|uniref:YegP family protein n=1 Tax=Mesorhizobium newzealandense TaxID=1300302 RepID=A0ABW4UHI0_9HYPH